MSRELIARRAFCSPLLQAAEEVGRIRVQQPSGRVRPVRPGDFLASSPRREPTRTFRSRGSASLERRLLRALTMNPCAGGRQASLVELSPEVTARLVRQTLF